MHELQAMALGTTHNSRIDRARRCRGQRSIFGSAKAFRLATILPAATGPFLATAMTPPPVDVAEPRVVRPGPSSSRCAAAAIELVFGRFTPLGVRFPHLLQRVLFGKLFFVEFESGPP